MNLLLVLALLGILLTSSCFATVVRLPLFTIAVSREILRCSSWQVFTNSPTEQQSGTPSYEEQSPATYH